MRLLVVGGHGNFGRALCRIPGVSVIPVGRQDWGRLDVFLDEDIDAIVHAASDVLLPVQNHPVAVMESNVMTVARLLESVGRGLQRRLIFLSSCAVYGAAVCTDEEQTCGPLTVNGISKLLGERLVAEYCASRKIPFQIVRLFNMYGGDDRFSVISRIERAVTGHEALQLNNAGSAMRDFVHVDDAALAVTRLLSQPLRHECINIGTGVATRIGDLVDIALKACPALKIQHRRVPEVDHSEAQVRRLHENIDIRFRDVKTYLQTQLEKHAAGNDNVK